MAQSASKPLISVLMPAFNVEHYVGSAIESVLKQSFADFELIVLNDGSSDGTAKIIDTYSDPRLTKIFLTENEGLVNARNTLVGMARGEYIAFLDSDDLWKPNKLEKHLSFMKENHLPFTFSFYECIDEEGINLKIRKEAPSLITYEKLFFCNYIGNSTAIYDARILGRVPIDKIRKRQDWMLWLTILKKIKTVKPVPEVLAYYRVRKNSISSSKIELLKFNFNVYNKFHKMNFFTSLRCVIIFIFTQFVIKPSYTKKS